MSSTRTSRGSLAKRSWTRLSDEQLLGLRFCDLKLKIERSPVPSVCAAFIASSTSGRFRFARMCGSRRMVFSDGVPASPCRSTWRIRASNVSNAA